MYKTIKYNSRNYSIIKTLMNDLDNKWSFISACKPFKPRRLLKMR